MHLFWSEDCNEKNHHINVSVMMNPKANLECARCGAYFDGNLGAAADVLGWNHKRKYEYDMLVQTVMGFDGD